MQNEQRVKFLKKLKVSAQRPLSKTTHPLNLFDSDMIMLWETFIQSPAFKSISSDWPKDVISFNFNTSMSWLSFLSNNHFTSNVDYVSAYRTDIQIGIKSHIRKSLSNLSMYKIVPAMKLSQVSYQMILPSKTPESVRANAYSGAKIVVLLTYVPSKSKMVDLRVKKGVKLIDSSIDKLLPSMQGYLYRDLPEYLKYHKPLSLDQLIKLPEYQWYRKDNLNLRHNGNSLALSFSYDYPGVIPMSDAPNLLKEFDKIMSTALRSIQ